LAVKIKFDNSYNVIQPTLMLSTRGGKRLGSVVAYNLKAVDSLNACFDFKFEVHKYIGELINPVWDEVQDFRLIYCPEYDRWFEIYVEFVDDAEVIKHISAVSIGEAELSQINLYGIEINTETDISRDDYEVTVLFDETNPNASLLNRIMEKAPHYTIKHVDASIAKIQRTFEFNEISIYDAFQEIATEINCIFIIDSGMNSDGGIKREISIYDLESYCYDCKTRGEFLHTCSNCESENIRLGYGEDTGIYISKENLADGITYASDNASVKNCFKLEAGDDLMTATLVNCNPNGSGYIWYFPNSTRNDMSDGLRSRLQSYDDLYRYYQLEHKISFRADVLSAYNNLVEKYSEYRAGIRTIASPIVGYPALMNAYYDTIDFYHILQNTLMPSVEISDTSADDQADRLTSGALSPVAVTDLSICSHATATSSVLAMAKTLIDPRYQVKVKSSNYSGNVWSGVFTVTNYSDEEDTADSSTISITITDNYTDFIYQRLEKAVSGASESPTEISGLFKLSLGNFKVRLRRYCLTSLQSFADACQACLDILIEQGVANDETWASQEQDLYQTIYLPYYQKLMAIQAEMKLRESEIAIIIGSFDRDGDLIADGLQNLIIDENNAIQDALNFEAYLGTDLWKEFHTYRRESTFRNENYISDGLDNAQLFANALEFMEIAKKELVKSATLQHSITATLKNLLVMPEFKVIVDNFKVGNWLRINVDGEIYRLRLISYEIDYDNLENISITFSDVIRAADASSDSESILRQAYSMASSYDSVKRQAGSAKKTQTFLDGWVTEGLALTKMKIVDSAKDQNITWDERGFLCRQYLPITDDYDDKQLKIINRGLYLTDDGWLTSKAGIGDFTFYNPETGDLEESYGVIADTLVGNLILGEKVGIYNQNNSIVLDQHGLTLTTNGENVPEDKNVFVIRRKDYDLDGNEQYVNLLYADNAGNLHFIGTLEAAEGKFTGEVVATSLRILGGDDEETPIEDYIDEMTKAELDALKAELTDCIDGKTTTYYGAKPSDPAVNDIWYDTANGKIFRYTNSGWVDITNQALKAALDAASDAQSTADGKIVTFAQSTQPTATAIGDLWINTSEGNKLYRWSGTKWVVYQDQAIVDAQEAADAAKQEALNALAKANSAQTSADNAKVLADSASEEAEAARIFANSIYNGTTGIYFTNSNVNELLLNEKVGLKITGKDNTYFQVMNDAMGFFRSDDSSMLYYENGNMYLSGYITALGGYIGGTGGWVIGTNSIYNGTASSLGASGGTYLGTDGISIGGSAFKYTKSTGVLSITGDIYANTGYIGGAGGWTIKSGAIYSGSASTLYSTGGTYIGSDGISIQGAFIVRADSEGADNIFEISSSTYDGVTSYELRIGRNVKFSSDFILPVENGGTGGGDKGAIGMLVGFYRAASEAAMERISGTTNGDICTLYSDGTASASMSGAVVTSHQYNSGYSNPGYLALASYKTYRDDTYCGIKLEYWNTTGLDGDSISGYARVGAGTVSSAHAGYLIPFDITLSGISSLSSIQVNFTFNTWPSGASRDKPYESKLVNPIKIKLFRASGNTNTEVANTSYTPPSGWNKSTNVDRSASITLTCIDGLSITQGSYYLLFYSKSANSLMWIKTGSIYSGEAMTGEHGIYVKSGGGWQAIAGGSGTGFVLTPADKTNLGGVIIGSTLSVDLDGTINVPTANSSTYGIVKSGNSSITTTSQISSGGYVACPIVGGIPYYLPGSSSGETTSGDYVPLAGGTMTGTLTMQNTYYPTIRLYPTYNNTSTGKVGVLETSYQGATSISIYDDTSGNNRRMLEVRSANYKSSLDDALALRTAVGGTYSTYRVFHEGMTSSMAKTALNTLGVSYKSSLPLSGVDGQVCMIPGATYYNNSGDWVLVSGSSSSGESSSGSTGTWTSITTRITYGVSFASEPTVVATAKTATYSSLSNGEFVNCMINMHGTGSCTFRVATNCSSPSSLGYIYIYWIAFGTDSSGSEIHTHGVTTCQFT